MGMFDTVRCLHPLPDPRHQDLAFQTKDLDCLLEDYTITRDGRLIRHAGRGPFKAGACRDLEWPVHGDVRIYESLEGADGERTWVEYVVRFTRGRVEWIRPAPKRLSELDEGESEPASDAAELPRARVGLPRFGVAAPAASHDHLWSIVRTLPSDFEPYGERSRDSDGGPDCSGGCRWFVALECALGYDWGACANARSPRAGLLTFEHQGCREFEGEPEPIPTPGG